MCFTSMKTLKKRYYTSFYDTLFKSYDAPSIRAAAILDLSNMAAREQISLDSASKNNQYGQMNICAKFYAFITI